MAKKIALKQLYGLLDDFAFLEKITGNPKKAKALKKAAQKVRGK
jgi:hypothetical protein